MKNLGGGEASLYERARELKEKGDWIPLQELLTYTEIGSEMSRPPVSYAEAGAFVKFLIDAYGREKFLEAYKSLKSSEDKVVHQHNREELERICGKSLEVLCQEWHAAMGLSDRSQNRSAGAGMAHLAGLASLERFDIGGTGLTDKGLAYLANMKKLDHLTLTGDFTDDGLRHLEGLTELGYLNVTSGGAFSNEALERLRKSLPKIQVFRVVP